MVPAYNMHGCASGFSMPSSMPPAQTLYRDMKTVLNYTNYKYCVIANTVIAFAHFIFYQRRRSFKDLKYKFSRIIFYAHAQNYR